MLLLIGLGTRLAPVSRVTSFSNFAIHNWESPSSLKYVCAMYVCMCCAGVSVETTDSALIPDALEDGAASFKVNSFPAFVERTKAKKERFQKLAKRSRRLLRQVCVFLLRPSCPTDRDCLYCLHHLFYLFLLFLVFDIVTRQPSEDD